MTGKRLDHPRIPANLVRYIASRDAALWLADTIDRPEDVAIAADLISLPWGLVLCESSSTELLKAVNERNQSSDWAARTRGFLHVVANDAQDLTLPQRALPLYMLNGRADGVGAEGVKPGRQAALRRRLNHIDKLVRSRPTLLVIVSRGGEQPFDDFVAQWQEGFRSYVWIAVTNDSDQGRVDEWLRSPEAPPSVDYSVLPLSDVVKQLHSAVHAQTGEGRIVVRLRTPAGERRDVDITDCELIEQPILEHYDLVQAKHLQHLQPSDLTTEDVQQFFDRSYHSWKPYAAGMPWPREPGAFIQVRRALERASREGADANRLFYIQSEPGAGGTTFARSIAYAVANEAYPTLLARQAPFRPDATEVESFLHRVWQKNLDPSDATPRQREPAWFVVFDAGHREGLDQGLRHFLGDITRRGRSVVVLVVVSDDSSGDLQNTRDVKNLGVLRHEMSSDEAQSLGIHLNRFLAPHGKTRTESEWGRFWEENRPHLDVPIASFWIALEFWLRGHLDLGESIQQWLYRQFRKLKCSNDVRLLLLEVAALTVEREPLPEGLMNLDPNERLPQSVMLEEIRTSAPALALLREGFGTMRCWALAHTTIARYLLESVFRDRQMLHELSLDAAAHPVELRLLLLGRIARRSELAYEPYRPLALDFAVRILKLDRDAGVEFFRYWREVLRILRSVPSALSNTSRTFNHHLAISERRAATNLQDFDAGLDERQELLESAIQHIEHALVIPVRAADDESSLNLFNSLSLAYQNLAELEREQGASDDVIKRLRAKATEAARRAQQEHSTNSYVLETLARNLLQDAELFADGAVENAVEALGYVYQAVQLERSEQRQVQLTKLARKALRLLKGPSAGPQIEALSSRGNPFGILNHRPRMSINT
jgi:hypothetical protein